VSGSAARSGPRFSTVSLLLLFLCGLALRWYHLGADSFWIDEFATLKTATLSLSGIVAENVGNKSFEPPLYFWAIHGLVRMLGPSELVLRFPSAIAGTLTIPVMWLLTRELTGSRRVALLSAAFVTLNPLHLWYSQEARPYALLGLFASLAIYYLARALREGTRGAWLGFTGSTLLAVFIHLTGLLLLAAAWAWAAARVRRPRTVVALVGSSAVVAACVAPLLWAIAHASVDRPGTGSPPRPPSALDIPYTLFTYVGGYSFGPSLREIQNKGAAAVVTHPVESGAVLAALALVLLLVIQQRPRIPVGFAALFAVYIGLAYLASVVTGKAYSIRYTFPALIAFLGILAVILRRPRGSLARATIALVVAVFLVADAQHFFLNDYRKDDSRAVVRWLADRLPRGALVEVAPGYVSGVLDYYARRQDADVRFIPSDAEVSLGHPAALLLTRLHHVTDPASEVERFQRSVGPTVKQDTVGGYLVWSAPDAARATSLRGIDSGRRPPDVRNRSSFRKGTAFRWTVRRAAPPAQREMAAVPTEVPGRGSGGS